MRPNGCIELLDEDEFEEHQKLYDYPMEVIEQAEQAATDIMALARANAFPFSEG